jgi:hypothetical protein
MGKKHEYNSQYIKVDFYSHHSKPARQLQKCDFPNNRDEATRKQKEWDAARRIKSGEMKCSGMERPYYVAQSLAWYS